MIAIMIIIGLLGIFIFGGLFLCGVIRDEFEAKKDIVISLLLIISCVCGLIALFIMNLGSYFILIVLFVLFILGSICGILGTVKGIYEIKDEGKKKKYLKKESKLKSLTSQQEFLCSQVSQLKNEQKRIIKQFTEFENKSKLTITYNFDEW